MKYGLLIYVFYVKIIFIEGTIHNKDVKDEFKYHKSQILFSR